jgi:hypothetical protein
MTYYLRDEISELHGNVVKSKLIKMVVQNKYARDHKSVVALP